MLIAGGAANTSAAAVPLQENLQKPPSSKATDLTARRRTRHRQHYAYRLNDQPYYPTYYDRPYYYAPAPDVPFNFGYPLLPPPWW
jgi:hypothetical protein